MPHPISGLSGSGCFTSSVFAVRSAEPMIRLWIRVCIDGQAFQETKLEMMDACQSHPFSKQNRGGMFLLSEEAPHKLCQMNTDTN